MQLSLKSLGECSAKKDVMLMETHGRNVKWLGVRTSFLFELRRRLSSQEHSESGLFLIPGQSECDEICFKDPVLKDKKWSAYIDRSPGSATYSELMMSSSESNNPIVDKILVNIPGYVKECFNACVAGCGYKFDIPTETVKEIHPNRPPPPVLVKPPRPAGESRPAGEPGAGSEDVLGTSA
ncbi:hypothetical protein Leryth_012427 [Lithospermum erythrorhizon]|nr:hypothetical protein Leryth_012427 [Lithospermum erythrorhizon]